MNDVAEGDDDNESLKPGSDIVPDIPEATLVALIKLSKDEMGGKEICELDRGGIGCGIGVCWWFTSSELSLMDLSFMANNLFYEVLKITGYCL